jgi:hypothetical protein
VSHLETTIFIGCLAMLPALFDCGGATPMLSDLSEDGGAIVVPGAPGTSGDDAAAESQVVVPPSGTAPTSVVCPICVSGQVCCLLDGQCIAPASAATLCPKPVVGPSIASPCSVGSTRGVPARLPLCLDIPAHSDGVCASNADCAPTDLCDWLWCTGPGYCTPRAACGTGYVGSVCGCDGVTYADEQSACDAGVRVVSMQACSAP